jgi:hypothetical protein
MLDAASSDLRSSTTESEAADLAEAGAHRTYDAAVERASGRIEREPS